jgi:ATP-dependent DNA helicase RecG
VLPPTGCRPGCRLREAVTYLHHPPPGRSRWPTLEDRSHPAWQRLKFEELLAQQLSQLQASRARAAARAGAAPARRPARALLAALPFQLTARSARGGRDRADLARTQPMHRLLQGDVGSGKTVVAALAAAVAIDAGWQCALMAPTEILAEQHFRKLVSGWSRWACGGLAHRQPQGQGPRACWSSVASGEARWWWARTR